MIYLFLGQGAWCMVQSVNNQQDLFAMLFAPCPMLHALSASPKSGHNKRGTNLLNHTILKYALLAAIIGIITCAKQLPPPGGPVDKTPPEVVKILPEPGAINVSTNTRIEVLFSEGMSRKTVEDAIFISPLPSENIFYKWKGKRFIIEFGDTLKENRTYVLTIGAKSSDLRNNKMKDSYSMAFSTGEKIDEGQVAGAVYGQSGIEGTLVCAYLIPDSSDVDPAKLLADYYTQCNQLGDFQLMYVAPGNYRLFAIRDRDGNRKYTRGIDALGITTKDIGLTPDAKFIENINFQITVEDTIPPSVKAVYAINQANLVVRFSEEIADFDEKTPDAYFKISAEQHPEGHLKIMECFKNSNDPSSLFMMTENQAAIDYKFIAQNILDKAGNTIDTASNTIIFPGNASPDTTKPTIISKSIKDSTSGVLLDHEIRFTFSEAMNQTSFEKHFRAAESDTLAVSGAFSWKNPADVVFQPDRSLKSLTWYTIHVEIDSIIDRSGNSIADSIKTIHFRTLNEDTLSAISGTIVDENEKGQGKLFVTAKSEKNFYHTIIHEPGQYRFEKILPGIYTINGFRDADSNGVYSYGRAIPFDPAERFFFFSDSIKVRSRWPNEGNDIVFK
jgi:uncharacterized protein (DUF2141 family)